MYLEPDAVGALEGDTLFYPCAGGDAAELFSAFSSQCRKFLYVDMGYDLSHPPHGPQSGDAVLRTSERMGPPASTIEIRRDGRSVHRFVEPGERREIYECNGELVDVTWRRGFAQFALWNLPDRSLRVFVHRGDSRGEGGSNVFFFENRRGRVAQLSNVFDTLCEKLSNNALVVSDGSNIVAPRQLACFHRRRDVSEEEAYAAMKDAAFEHGPFAWRCCGFMGARYGPTLIWRLRRL